MQVLENGGYDDNAEIKNVVKILKFLLHYVYEEIVVYEAVTETNICCSEEN
jgi:predicted nucleic acid-binding protein